MKLPLREFQKTAAERILDRLAKARRDYLESGDRSAIGLAATTGAGKTIIATAIIEAVLMGSEEFGIEPDPDAVFLWMTDMPKLNAQTATKMLAAKPDFPASTIVEMAETFNEERLAVGRVYFLNTQKLGEGALLTRRGPGVKRAFNFYDIVRSTVEDSPTRTLYLIVDEAHRGMNQSRAALDEADSIIQRFILGYANNDDVLPAAPVVLGISATPARFNALVDRSGRTTWRWEVPIADVQASGLIKDRTLTGFAAEKQRDAMASLLAAARAWNDAGDHWAAYHAEYAKGDDSLVVPALIIQVENEPKPRAGSEPVEKKPGKADPTRPVTQTPLAEVIKGIEEIAGALPDDAYVHAFGEGTTVEAGGRKIRYVEPQDIADDTDARVVFFKSSLGTGWDCPRAEVMVSFRRAVDPTSIAQTIGRMVRTPLHRRIVEDERLNNAWVYLPFYDKAGVTAIVKQLNETGNEALAATIEVVGSSVELPLRAAERAAIDAIEKLPSSIVGTPRKRAEIRTLIDMATFLAAEGIEADAYANEKGALADLLVARCIHLLANDPTFADEVADHGDIVIRVVPLNTLLGVLEGEGDLQHLPASETLMASLRAKAKTTFVGDVVKAFVERRVAAGFSVRDADLQISALAARDSVKAALENYARDRIDAIRAEYGARIEGLSAAKNALWHRILREAPSPTPTTVKLVPVARFATEEDATTRVGHLYADGDDKAPIKLNELEQAVIDDAVKADGFVAWLRSVDRAEWALCLPYTDQKKVERPFYPDFLVVRQVGTELKVDVLDPHNHNLPDAVGKAQGLADYASKHAEKLGHVDLIDDPDGTGPRRLHLERKAIRDRVNGVSSRDDLRNLYLDRGEPLG